MRAGTSDASEKARGAEATDETSSAGDAGTALISAGLAAGGPAAAAQETPEQRPVVVTRITPLGVGVLATGVVLAAGAFVLRYAELAALAAAALSALLLAGLAVARRPRLRATLRVRPGGVPRGEPAALVVELHNPHRRPSPRVRVEILWSHGARGLPPAPGRRRRRALATAGEVRDARWAGAGARAGQTSPAGRGAAVRGAAGPAAEASIEEASPTSGADRRRWARAGGTIVVDVRRLGGASSRSLELPLDTQRRGMIGFGPVLVRRSDPFGLVSSASWLAAADVLRVRPRAVPLGAAPAAPARDPDGRTADGAAGGVIFHGLREYVSGEDLRFVHWPSSARTGVLMVREHVEPSEPASTVVLDTRPVAYPPGEVGAETFEEAVDVAASVLLGCAQESLGVVLLTTAGVRRPGRGRAPETYALLDDLAEVDLDPAGTLDVLGTVRRGGVGTLVVVTGGFDDGQLRAVAPVVHRFGQVVVVRVGARSLAAARARSRRTPAGRPRLRRASSAPDAATLLGRFDLIGRPSEIGTSVAGRLRVVDIPDAARLAEVWPVGSRGRAAGVRSNARAGYFGGGVV
ncbi:DUF58 domain-containing protein [Pseudofrankia sp. DC12]|uniref:DUF58 domain-containing protein n=1 Tax=Pseudofrankia sp. DC12 TaxID=683315 RepID=UPI000AC04099|nr:DUF58 domain-containing protein [Pseudofrankia sp. DC12]